MFHFSKTCKDNEPVRLYPKKENKTQIKLCQIRFILITAIIILALILFVATCYAIVPPTESGMFYNHLGGI